MEQTNRRAKLERLRAWAELMDERLPDDERPDFTSTALRQSLSGPSDKRK